MPKTRNKMTIKWANTCEVIHQNVEKVSKSHFNTSTRQRMGFIKYLLAFGCLYLALHLVIPQAIQFDNVLLQNTTYKEGVYNISVFRIAKFNRSSYVLNVEVDLIVDFDKDYQVEVAFYYNPLNNQQYTLHPFRVQTAPFCNISHKFYNTIYKENIEQYTNFPVTKSGVNNCPLKKVSTKKIHNQLNNMFNSIDSVCLSFRDITLCETIHSMARDSQWRSEKATGSRNLSLHTKMLPY